ncbi:hypothetical protein DPMN_146921 [Dreissena polymorpha]|uniref:Uncharacterized protein n=1 Tax=Dreissena polymorpha TaxID=45954 RepID=A0A9D4FCP9_DREPO|nr:hypothetical protein DPMN_146921 [Dreissena polymorpha]
MYDRRPFRSWKFLKANSVDPDETPHQAFFRDARHNWVKNYLHTRHKSHFCNQFSCLQMYVGQELTTSKLESEAGENVNQTEFMISAHKYVAGPGIEPTILVF